MKFHYQGIDNATGQRVKGEVDGLSEHDVVRQLTQQRIDVLALEPAKKVTKKGRNVKEADLVVPLQEMATLTSAGVTLIDAVRALAQNNEHQQLASGFAKIANHIEGGGSLSEAIAASKLPFPGYVQYLVSAGELSGQLATALTNASEQLLYEQSVRSDVKSALTYPLVLIGAGIGAMLIIFFAVVPKFSHMLDDDKPLPWLAFMVLSAGRKVNDSPWVVIGVIVAIIALLGMIFTQPAVKRRVMDFLLQTPVIGTWLSEQDAARWASLSAAMLEARVNLVHALRLAAKSSSFTRRRRSAEAMVQDVEGGMTFTEALERARLLPSTSLNLISVGDKTGQLAEMLKAVARLHDNAVKRRMKQVLTIMEPLAILIVGSMIGVMILGVVLAITASTDIAI